MVGECGRFFFTSCEESLNERVSAFGAPFTLSLVIRHFEVARETGSRWFSKALWDCFGGRIFNMAAIFVPQNSPTMRFHNHLDRSPAQPQIVETDRAHFELLSCETFAKLNVGAIAFESISLLPPNLCLLLVIVL